MGRTIDPELLARVNADPMLLSLLYDLDLLPEQISEDDTEKHTRFTLVAASFLAGRDVERNAKPATKEPA